jgi:hypothetical protein
MSTIELKDKIQKRLAEIEDESFLKEIYSLISDDETTYEFSAEQEIRIEQALEEIRQGKVISNDDVKRDAEEWLRK